MICSQPGCGETSIGKVLSPTTRQNRTPAHQGGKPLGTDRVGEICLQHLRTWFPAQDDDWLIAWVERQSEEAKRIYEVDRGLAEQRVDVGVDKNLRLPRGIIRR